MNAGTHKPPGSLFSEVLKTPINLPASHKASISIVTPELKFDFDEPPCPHFLMLIC